MSDAEAEPSVVEIERQSPGAYLRQTREAQGLTLGEVAGALKFSTRQIEALERDDYDQLKGKTFLRGFIRAYARMLKVQPENVLALLDVQETAALPAPEQIVPPVNMGETDPTPFYRRYTRQMLMIAALVLLGFAIIWLVDNQPPASNKSVVETVKSSQVTIPVNIDQAGLSSVATLTESVSGTAATPATLGLSFEFSDRSWLEVKDSSGQTLLTGEFPGGQKQTTNGKPPYQLWIGKASAVKVIYKDQVVDTLPYTRDEVARLTLDQ